ncbi:hypothetical protein N7510_006331 [Penicillium lagena]|uniref:uncharacterized protein n=1 Tax=Penicillium lagena TaxID=94218 RepID=UPI00253FA9DC|nr:uncharacterized protein N7510_006331 [Penicillium lagena]KAJ5613137.1 hypothetical protein N7510_006331 [Penicillium lagena]
MYPTRILRMQATRPMFRPAPVLSWGTFYLTSTVPFGFATEAQISICASRDQTFSCHVLTLCPCSVAVVAAIYSSGHKLMTDKTLRLSRNSPESREH